MGALLVLAWQPLKHSTWYGKLLGLLGLASVLVAATALVTPFLATFFTSALPVAWHEWLWAESHRAPVALAATGLSLYVVGVLLRSRSVQARDEAGPTAAEVAALSRIKLSALPVVANPGLVMRYKTEVCHWAEAGVTLHQEETQTGYGGLSVGTTVRVASLPLRIGGHGGRVEKDAEVAPVGTGGLFVTSHRLIFVGERRTTTVPLRKVAFVAATPEFLVLGTEGAATKNLYFQTQHARVLEALVRQVLSTRV
jgi:hypothetical protein